MKTTFYSILALIVFVACWLTPGSAQNPVVVELFTSEGCSSCPPADAELMKLSQHPPAGGTELILLGEHVDYWNYIGWTDRFSSAQFSQRQNDYARAFHISGPYTPQMVIDGREQFVGGDSSDVQEKILAAGRQPLPVLVGLQWDKNNLRITLQNANGVKGKVLLAITEDNLSTAVGSGENGGRTLHHAAVVRQLKELGSTDKTSFETAISPAADWNASQLKVAVLVQDSGTKKILGAVSIPYAH